MILKNWWVGVICCLNQMSITPILVKHCSFGYKQQSLLEGHVNITITLCLSSTVASGSSSFLHFNFFFLEPLDHLAPNLAEMLFWCSSIFYMIFVFFGKFHDLVQLCFFQLNEISQIFSTKNYILVLWVSCGFFFVNQISKMATTTGQI